MLTALDQAAELCPPGLTPCEVEMVLGKLLPIVPQQPSNLIGGHLAVSAGVGNDDTGGHVVSQ